MSLEQKQGNGEHKQGTVHVHALHTTTGVDKNLSHPLGWSLDTALPLSHEKSASFNPSVMSDFCNLMDSSQKSQASLSLGFPRQEYRSG